jgi:hypothetical protein
MVSKYDLEYYEEKSVKYAWTIPIACGIFTFIYWFILTPILWNAIDMKNDSQVFGIFMMSMAIFWGVIVGLLMCIWWFKKWSGKPFKEKAAKDRVSVVQKDSGDNVSNNSDSPPFPTQPHMVQPSDTPVSYSFNELHRDSEKDIMSISLSSCPVQLQGTPSLYNARTGRQSFELGSGDSSGSVSIQNAGKNPLDYESGILTVKKSDATQSAICKRISSTDSEGEKGDVLKEPSLWKNKAGHDRSITVETAVIEHNTHNLDMSDFLKEAIGDSEVPGLSSSDSFHGLPEMNSFDAYLHLTKVDTPMTPPTEGTSPTSAGLTPRQLFFIDLIKQAEANQTAPCIRRSVGDEVMPRQKTTADNRKSMPLYLHFTSNPESSFSSPKHVLDEPAVVGCPVNSESAISVTDSEDHGLSSPSQKVTHDDLQSDMKNTESEYTGPEDGTDTKTGSNVTGGEYFIANITRNKSVTSEVYLNIDSDAVTVVEPGTSMQWEFVVDDDNLSDDCVFEDDAAVQGKKK